MKEFFIWQVPFGIAGVVVGHWIFDAWRSGNHIPVCVVVVLLVLGFVAAEIYFRDAKRKLDQIIAEEKAAGRA